MTLLGQPLRLMNLRKLLMNYTESRLGTRSNTIPLLGAHVYSVTLYMEVLKQNEHNSYHPVFSDMVHVSRALISKLISLSTFARSQVFSLIFLVTVNFNSGGSFSNISVDIKAP